MEQKDNREWWGLKAISDQSSKMESVSLSYLTIHRTSPYNKVSPDLNVSNAKGLKAPALELGSSDSDLSLYLGGGSVDAMCFLHGPLSTQAPISPAVQAADCSQQSSSAGTALGQQRELPHPG